VSDCKAYRSLWGVVCGWRFKPATLDGKPVKVYHSLTINFQVRGR
jgi:hypothetical protein